MKSSDPRAVVTPDAFSVEPELVGIRLAGPWRRLGAIAIDGALVSLVARTSLAVLVGLVAALLLWRAVAPAAGHSITQRVARIALRITIAVFAFILVLKLLNALAPDRRGDDGPGMSVTIDGMLDEDLDMTSAGLAPDSGSGATEDGTAPEDTVVGPDSAAAADSAAAGNAPADSAPADSARAALAAENAALRQQTEQLARRTAELEERIERQEESGPVRAFFSEIADELGLGLGWFGFYFTALTVLGRGQTPGKRLLGIRVIRLDARPIGWWIAFERFGGYAASFFSGTLGFAQILWDRNRQALHDKATETVVIRVQNGEPVRAPGGAALAGYAQQPRPPGR